MAIKRKTTKPRRRKASNAGCYYCDAKKLPNYLDSDELSRFMTDRAKIIGKEFSGLCSKHQRKLGIAVKRARHLALLPFRASI